jgi:hypothetical protein
VSTTCFRGNRHFSAARKPLIDTVVVACTLRSGQRQLNLSGLPSICKQRSQ